MTLRKVAICFWLSVFILTEEGISQETDCEREKGQHCHKWAQCEQRQGDQRPRCYCSPGFGGDGYNCHRDNQNRKSSGKPRCPQPANIAHGSYSASDGSYRIGTAITYRCQDGYKLQGPSRRTCQQSRQWSGSQPKCDQVECRGLCQRPQNLEGGTMTVGGNCAVGSRVSYKCNQGLMLVGSSDRTCKGDGQWTGTHPRCEKSTDCEREDGKHCHQWAQCERRQEDKKPRCYCSPGYRGDGYNCHQRRDDECQKRNHQTCHVHADCVRKDEDKYECKCRDHYKGDGIYCESKGCDKPPGVTHGKILSNQQRYVRGNIITYQCNEGYKLMGEAQRTCQDDGQWSGNEPRCEKKQSRKPPAEACKHPQNIQDGTITVSDWNLRPGSTVTYECRKPYQLQGNSQRTCQDTGKWSGSMPRCQDAHHHEPPKKKVCQRLQDIQHGSMTVTDWNFKSGSTVTFECRKPYQLHGNSKRTCQDNGEWSGSKPKCQKLQLQGRKCQRPRDIPNGSLRTSDGSYKPRTVITYECQHPYRLVGDLKRTCLGNGKWSGSTPRCEDSQASTEKRCERPPDYLPHGRITVSDYQFRPGTVIEYACERGWRLQGPTKRTCQDGGRWSGTFPRCQKVRGKQKDKCENRCHENAECRTENDKGKCICQPPYFGDGYYCQGCQGGQVFQQCVTKCPPTCDNLQPICDRSCDETNKCVCPGGKVQRSASDKTCVDRNECSKYA